MKVSLNEPWIYLDSLIKIGNSLIILPHFYISPPSVVIGMSKPWIYLNGLTEV